MEFEFDKEMDALLRQAARGGDVVSTGAHLDADEISAFAENALPEKAKMLYTAHLADCGRCRKILSHLITLESQETANEAVSSVVEEKTVALAIPWYRKIFAMPNLAYTMGALALLFSGLIAFIFLQSSGSLNKEISQASEDSMTANRAANTSSAAAPMAVNSNMTAMNANSSANSASVYSNMATTANSSMANVPLPSLTPNTFADATPSESNNFPNPQSPVNELSRERDKDLAKTDRTQGEQEAIPPAARKAIEENKQAAEVQSRSDNNEAATTKSAPKPNVAQPAPSASGATTTTEDRSEKKAKSERAETTTSGGKTFRRANNVWYDTEYKNQATTNITRGTSEYKKLDSGLRRIAENLGGTVVIVWKSRAYRIQ